VQTPPMYISIVILDAVKLLTHLPSVQRRAFLMTGRTHCRLEIVCQLGLRVIVR
jgi:hypothetical protein